MVAALKGFDKIVKALLAKERSEKKMKIKGSGYTTLMIAVKMSHHDVANELLKPVTIKGGLHS